jgi:hypothetical protein
MPVTLFLSISMLAILAAWVFIGFYRKHIQGVDAPELKADVTILDMQAVEVTDPKPEEEDQEYWIYVQKGAFGPKREFKIGVHYFHALKPGNKGTLTYKGDKFLHFALKK